jgi:PEP-CTERM motif
MKSNDLAKPATTLVVAVVLSVLLGSSGNAASILVDFGPSNNDDGRATTNPDVNGNYWNSWRPIEGDDASAPDNIPTGTAITNLISTTNFTTPVSLTTTTSTFRTNGILSGGLLSPNPALLGDFAIGTATEDYFFLGVNDLSIGGNATSGGILISGLTPGSPYNMRFFGTRNTTAETRETQYAVTDTLGTHTANLVISGNNIGSDGAYDGNDNHIASLTGLIANAGGQLQLDVSRVQGSFAYLGIMEISGSVPEPASLTLAGLGAAMLGLGFVRRRR